MDLELRVQERIEQAKHVIDGSEFSYYLPHQHFSALLPLQVPDGIRPVHLFEVIAYVPLCLPSLQPALMAGVKNTFEKHPLPGLVREYQAFTSALSDAGFTWRCHFPLDRSAQFYRVESVDDLEFALFAVQDAIAQIVGLYEH